MSTSIDASTEDAVTRWRRQIGARKPYRRQRPLAALGFLNRPEGGDSSLVELRRLLAVVLFDEPISRPAPALRLIGYGAVQIPHGVQWGGRENSKLYKDLRLEPQPRSWGLRIDAENEPLLKLALQLQALLYRADRFAPRIVRTQPHLPRLWAGFAANEIDAITASGPEFAELCAKFDLPPEVMLVKFRRPHQGLVCLPLDWVSEQLSTCLAIFADLAETPRAQVFTVPELPGGLQGYQGAVAYDFFQARQRAEFAPRAKRWEKQEPKRTVLPESPTRATTAEPVPPMDESAQLLLAEACG